MKITLPVELDQDKSRQDFLHGKLKMVVFQGRPRRRRDGELLTAYPHPASTVKSNMEGRVILPI